MDYIQNDAIISPCGKYRYSLHRRWNFKPTICFIGLNPSTANATKDDPTIRRCVRFADSWGYGGIIMVNLFAYRSTNPDVLTNVDNPIGIDNEFHIDRAINYSLISIAAWGAGPKGILSYHVAEIGIKYKNKLHVLSLTKDGSPSHPLYLPKNLKPVLWNQFQEANE